MAQFGSTDTSVSPISDLGGVVHVWMIPLTEGSSADLEALAKCLSASERGKLQRLSRPAGRQAFLVSRGALRHVLGGYLQQPPKALDFTYGPQGKPALKLKHPTAQHQDDSPWCSLEFNLSHSGDWVVIALCQGRSIGVDIELIRLLSQLPSLCQRCLTPAETATVQGLEPTQANLRFLQYWTGKEAYLKALGLGLTASMTSVELAIPPGAIALQPAPITPEPLHDQGWHIYQWQPSPEYIAAIAVQTSALTTHPQIQLYQTTTRQLIHSDDPLSIGFPAPECPT